MTEFVTHNQLDIRVSGTYYQGFLRATYDLLIAVFGEPIHYRNEKIDLEWSIQFNDGVVATIYNWKNGPYYTGDPLEKITLWHIGGHSRAAFYRIAEIVGIDD